MRHAFAAALLVACCGLAHAQADYRPQQAIDGTIRIWGHDAMRDVVERWIAGFRRFHPRARFETTLLGSATAMPGLYSGRADIALLGRAEDVTDDNGFSRPKQYAPTRYELMNGSLATHGMAPALVVFVHRDNPLDAITLDQLDALFGCERRRGHAQVRTWGDLGLGGAWAREPIHLHAFDMASGTGVFFQHAVLRDSRKMNWDALVEHATGHETLAAVEADRHALGIATLADATPGVKPVALAVDSRGPFVVATRETVIARTYPLARRTYAFVDQQPGMALDPKVQEFLRYALSREGQGDVARSGGYLPLDAATDAAQLGRLGSISALEKAASSEVAGPALRFVDELPAYRAQRQVAGTITLWGHGSFKHDFMGPLVHAWADAFRRHQPGVTFEYRMYGTASAIGALYTGAGNLAILGEEIGPDAARAFRRAKGYAPTGIDIATGSLDVDFFDYAHMVFVHKDNPLRSLDLAQLEAIFGTEHKRSGRNIRTWGEAGVAGALASCPIQPYGWKVDEDFALFFREAVLEGSHRWNPAIREYIHARRADGTQYDRGARILDALANDPCGIAISNVRYAGPLVRPLALARAAGEPAYVATHASLIAQDYPLTRIIPAFIDVPPGRGADPAVSEFLRFVLSREGQQAIIDQSGYLPLGAAAIRAQLAHLDALGVAPRAASVVSAPDGSSTDHALRIVGNPRMHAIAGRWAARFMRRHPGAHIEIDMTGTDVGMAALYAGRADIALSGREATANEVKAFEWIHRYPPADVEVATGGAATPGESPALVAFVSRDNPITHLDTRQLAALFLANPGDGMPRVLRTWGDLGLTGDWADEPVRLYTFDATSGSGVFLRHAVMDDRRDLDWARVTELADTGSGRASLHDASRKILAAAAMDRYGLAVASGPAPDGLRPLALGTKANAVAPTAANIAARRYPLSRPVFAYFDRKPGSAIDPRIEKFLRYALGPEGQRDVAEIGDYLPLSRATARQQTRRLE